MLMNLEPVRCQAICSHVVVVIHLSRKCVFQFELFTGELVTLYETVWRQAICTHRERIIQAWISFWCFILYICLLMSMDLYCIISALTCFLSGNKKPAKHKSTLVVINSALRGWVVTWIKLFEVYTLENLLLNFSFDKYWMNGYQREN